MTTDTIKHLGAEVHHAADGVGEALQRLERARTARLAFLRECSKDSTARLAMLKEEVRTLPEQIAKWDAEAARLESQTAEDLLRQALERAQKCDGDHIGPPCSDKQCWLRDPEEAEQPTMSCPSCKREYPDFDGAGVVFCDPKQGGCGFCRHVELKGQPMGDKTVMVCTACWEAQEEEQPKPEPYRAGLPPERLRKVWAEWEMVDGVVYVFQGNKYRCTYRPLTEWWDIGAEHTWRASYRPHGATWARVEAMADEAEKPKCPACGKAARFRARPYIPQVASELISGGRILPEEVAALGEP